MRTTVKALVSGALIGREVAAGGVARGRADRGPEIQVVVHVLKHAAGQAVALMVGADGGSQRWRRLELSAAFLSGPAGVHGAVVVVRRVGRLVDLVVILRLDELVGEQQRVRGPVRGGDL